MQDMLKKIVEMDQQARKITDAAQLEKIDSEKEVSKKREEIREQYLARARHRIEINRPLEQKAAEEDWEKAKKRNEALAKEMDELYVQKGGEWIDAIVAKVIGE
ncbi:Eukaryotic translation initiation factor 3 110 kDa subunit [Ruminococcaceae bacterium BL-6]|nr:Eukaryotic translation initiation factor 3 110 kDa subunit [Ruminococcaceae bacterium BL-6]